MPALQIGFSIEVMMPIEIIEDPFQMQELLFVVLSSQMRLQGSLMILRQSGDASHSSQKSSNILHQQNTNVPYQVTANMSMLHRI